MRDLTIDVLIALAITLLVLMKIASTRFNNYELESLEVGRYKKSKGVREFQSLFIIILRIIFDRWMQWLYVIAAAGLLIISALNGNNAGFFLGSLFSFVFLTVTFSRWHYFIALPVDRNLMYKYIILLPAGLVGLIFTINIILFEPRIFSWQRPFVSFLIKDIDSNYVYFVKNPSWDLNPNDRTRRSVKESQGKMSDHIKGEYGGIGEKFIILNPPPYLSKKIGMQSKNKIDSGWTRVNRGYRTARVKKESQWNRDRIITNQDSPDQFVAKVQSQLDQWYGLDVDKDYLLSLIKVESSVQLAGFNQYSFAIYKLMKSVKDEIYWIYWKRNLFDALLSFSIIALIVSFGLFSAKENITYQRRVNVLMSATLLPAMCLWLVHTIDIITIDYYVFKIINPCYKFFQDYTLAMALGWISLLCVLISQWKKPFFQLDMMQLTQLPTSKPKAVI